MPRSRPAGSGRLGRNASLAVAALACWLAADAAGAAPDSVAADSVAADSVAADSLAADSAGVPGLAAEDRLDQTQSPGDTLAVPAAAVAPAPSDGGFLRSPTGIMLRSLVVPGWGQAANGEWVKAGLVAAAEGYLIYTLVRDSNRLSELDPGTLEYANLENQRNASAWWLGGVVFLSMVDAYVGAHLRGIEVRIGPEPETQEVRVGLRREF